MTFKSDGASFLLKKLLLIKIIKGKERSVFTQNTLRVLQIGGVL